MIRPLCRHTSLAVALVLSFALMLGAFAQQASRAVHPVSGRQFANVMSYLGADWLDREERDIEEAPDAALDALDLGPGMVVADVGAGSGYITTRMARRVAPGG